MHDDQLGAAVFGLVVMAMIAGIALGLSSYQCSSRWEKSGFAKSWGPIQGCLIQHDGKWIPEENYREMP